MLFGQTSAFTTRLAQHRVIFPLVFFRWWGRPIFIDSPKKGLHPGFALPRFRFFVKAGTLPAEMAASLAATHGKTRDRIAAPGHEALAASVKALSTSTEGAQQQGSRIQDEEICDLLAELEIEPGRPIAQEAVKMIQRWAAILGEKDWVAEDE